MLANRNIRYQPGFQPTVPSQQASAFLNIYCSLIRVAISGFDFGTERAGEEQIIDIP